MKRTSIVTIVLTLVANAAFAQSRPPYGGTWCGVGVIPTNDQRQVYGVIQAECTYACPSFWNWHDSHPFGNWGIDSYYGSRHDINQFAGWASYNPYCDEHPGNPEWNSCTSDMSLWGNSSYYNDGPNYRTQSSPVSMPMARSWFGFPRTKTTVARHTTGSKWTQWEGRSTSGSWIPSWPMTMSHPSPSPVDRPSSRAIDGIVTVPHPGNP